MIATLVLGLLALHWELVSDLDPWNGLDSKYNICSGTVSFRLVPDCNDGNFLNWEFHIYTGFMSFSPRTDSLD